jgi:hypothetical protein
MVVMVGNIPVRVADERFERERAPRRAKVTWGLLKLANRLRAVLHNFNVKSPPPTSTSQKRAKSATKLVRTLIYALDKNSNYLLRMIGNTNSDECLGSTGHMPWGYLSLMKSRKTPVLRKK